MLFRSDFVIVGTARDVAKSIEKEVSKFIDVFQKIGKFKILIIESDSGDSTTQKLEKLAAKHREFEFISLGNVRFQIPDRIERLIYCRNRYIAEINNRRDFSNSKYICVADFDKINTKIESSSIIKSLSLKSNWDAIGANQSTRYYDILALRHEYWCPNNAWSEYLWFSSHSTRKDWKTKSVYERMIHIPRHLEPFKVMSAYGGFIIYKTKSLLGYDYSWAENRERGDIDQVNLHKKMVGDGKIIFIDPQLINGGWNVHNLGSIKPLRVLIRFVVNNRFLLRFSFILSKLRDALLINV